LIASGAYLNAFWLMLVGRVIYAIGGDTLDVTQDMRAVKWFQGKELNMVFGIQASLTNLGSSLTFIGNDYLYNFVKETQVEGSKVIGITFFIAGILIVLDLMNSVIMMFRDNRAERILKDDMKILRSQECDNKIRLKDILEFNLSFWIISLIIGTYNGTIFPFISFGK